MITFTLAALLGADATVRQLTGGAADRAPAVTQNRLDDKLPPCGIVLQLISETETQTLADGPVDTLRARVQLTAWATKGLTAAAAYKAAHAVLKAIRRETAEDGTYVIRATRDSKSSRYDAETEMQGVSADYLVWFVE